MVLCALALKFYLLHILLIIAASHIIQRHIDRSTAGLLFLFFAWLLLAWLHFCRAMIMQSRYIISSYAPSPIIQLSNFYTFSLRCTFMLCMKKNLVKSLHSFPDYFLPQGNTDFDFEGCSFIRDNYLWYCNHINFIL